MSYRLLQYMARVWGYYLENHTEESERKSFRLPAIVPLVVYNGVRRVAQ
jgi:hypothetical protein